MNRFIEKISVAVLVLLFVSCQKNVIVNKADTDQYLVSFKFSGFDSQTSILKSSAKLATTTEGNSQNHSEGYLYYWSFNNEDLIPDIQFSTDFEPEIIYANGEIPNAFVNSSYAYENFSAGKAIAFSGAKEILIKLPISGVVEISDLGFDVGSPSRGPKDFELYYSVDKGENYIALALNNQFGITNTANHKHTYTYDLRDKNLVGEEVWFQILPKAGERGTAGDFNENAGTLRMDNLFLTGVASTDQKDKAFNKIHYYFFDKDDSRLVLSGIEDLNDRSSIELSLPAGSYQMCFISNTSEAELLLPDSPSLTTLYAGNFFSNSNADIFAYKGELVVSQASMSQIELERLYSQIKVEFTDSQGLDEITKIVIDQGHDPFFYAPFNLSLQNPVLDQSSIERVGNFAINKQLVFNQFMGQPIDAQSISYNVQVYNGSILMRSLILEGTIKNNMQLVFRGNLLEDTTFDSSFDIQKNEEWSGQELEGY